MQTKQASVNSLKIENYFVHTTMADELKKQGLFVDESFNLRVLERDVQEDTSQLKDENEVFLESEIWCDTLLV